MTATAPPRRRTRTTGTVVLLVVCLLVAAAAVTTAALLPGYVRDAPRRDADRTLRAFLDEATTLDPNWRDAASPLLKTVVPIGAPLLGERTTANALKLSADYEVAELRFSSDDLQRSDTASAVVTIRYRYTILGEKGTASIPQKIWLTRPFYHAGDEPQQADATALPTAVGPWRVTGITLPSADELDAASASASDLTSDERTADTLACYSPTSALVQVADRARIDGVLASSCFLGDEDGSDVLGAGVDAAALLAAFPAIEEDDPASIPPELVRIDGDIMHGMRAPFTQYLIADRYTVTFAAVTTDDGDDTVRLISIQDVEAGR